MSDVLSERFRILTEGAKYDVSCSSSGSDRGAKDGKVGLCNAGGVCHSFTADGRCISLLKILMTNNCIYDCKYCINRSSQDTPRATLSPKELCDIVMQFYKRNYIEGLFLSSAVFKSPDYTMEMLTKTVVSLRDEHNFNGYIHLKGIPGADPRLIENAALYVDRMSMNIELPTPKSLQLLAPQKSSSAITLPMRQLSVISKAQKTGDLSFPKMIPAGQTTQMIIGASPDSDGVILKVSERLYREFLLRRVYYSAYVPLGDPKIIPENPPDLLRENRLYQADWLLRFYGFDADELLPVGQNLPRDIDPKCAWALRNLDKFPIEINKAPYEVLLRVPGIGVKSAMKITEARRYTKLKIEDLKRMRVVLKRAAHFILCDGIYHGRGFNEVMLRNAMALPAFVKAAPEQLSLYGSANAMLASEI